MKLKPYIGRLTSGCETPFALENNEWF